MKKRGEKKRGNGRKQERGESIKGERRNKQGNEEKREQRREKKEAEKRENRSREEKRKREAEKRREKGRSASHYYSHLEYVCHGLGCCLVSLIRPRPGEDKLRVQTISGIVSPISVS